MEAVAAIASVAGIISLAGQALDGLLKLRAFYNDCASASNSISRFLRDLNSLIQTLEDVKDIVVKLEDAPNNAGTYCIPSLQVQLEVCSKDVYNWVRVASDHRPQGVDGSRAAFRKFLVGVNKGSFDYIFWQIASHKESISVKLSVIGRSLDIDHSVQLQSIGSKLDDAASVAANNNQVTFDALQRLEAQLTKEGPDVQDSPILQSLASSLSRIENLLSSRPGSIASAKVSSIGSRRASFIAPRHTTPPASMIGSNRSSAGSQKGGRRASFSLLPTYTSSSQQGVKPSESSTSPKRTLDDVFTRWREQRKLPNFNLGICSGATDLITPKSPLTPPVHNFAQTEEDVVQGQSRGRRSLIMDSNISISKQNLGEPPKFTLSHPVKVNPYEQLKVLLETYDTLTEIPRELPDSLAEYLDRIYTFKTISLEVSMRSVFFSAVNSHSEESVERRSEVYNSLLSQLETLRKEADEWRAKCWEEGCDLGEVDRLLETFHLQGEQERKARDELNQNSDLVALCKRLQRFKMTQAVWVKQERINAWLLQNLAASSDGVALHRSFLSNSTDLDEKQWARLVLKFWPLDEAAAEPIRQSLSTEGADKSGKGSHGVRVLLKRAELNSEMYALSSSAGH